MTEEELFRDYRAVPVAHGGHTCATCEFGEPGTPGTPADCRARVFGLDDNDPPCIRFIQTQNTRGVRPPFILQKYRTAVALSQIE